MAAAAAIAQIVGAGLNAYGTIAAGNAAEKMGEIEQAQLNENALQVEAVSQREAIAERRQARQARSRAKAVSAASGLSADDEGAQRIDAELEAQGEYNAMAALYSGYDEAKKMRRQGEIAATDGRNAKKASRIAAVSTILGTGSSMYQQYGGGGMSGGAR